MNVNLYDDKFEETAFDIFADWPSMGSIKQDIKETYLGIYETAQEKWADFAQFFREAWPLLLILLIGHKNFHRCLLINIVLIIEKMNQNG